MPLLNTILESKEENHFLDNIEVSEYWNEHYVLDKLSKHKSKTLGEDFKSILKINVFAPVLFAYGKYRNDDSYTDKAFQLLYQIHGESNTKTKVFESTKFKHENAFDTQAMIELYDNYCTRKRCLECAIGHKILRTNNPELIANNL